MASKGKLCNRLSASLATGLVTLALLPLLLISLAGCTESNNPATDATEAQVTASSVVATAPKGPVRVTAQGLSYESRPGKDPVGATVEFTVQVEPSSNGQVAVGVLEGEVSGTGPQWRATSWAAPIAATSLLNLNLADYKITYEVSGRVDGPSAGGLMTVATLAALLGDELKPDATMTGTINPDYTIGPVGGIPQKLEGAAAAGKKLVLVPLGERMDADLAKGQFIDVIEKGTSLGIEVREVGDVYEAYEALTGKPLPQAEAAATPPVISKTAYKKIEELTKDWIVVADQAVADYEAVDAAYKTDYQEILVDEALSYMGDADKYLVQGVLGAAYSAAQLAAFEATLAYTYGEVLRAVEVAGPQGVAAELKGMGFLSDVNQLATKLVATSPKNIGEASCLVDAWGSLTLANSLGKQADALLARLPAMEDEDARYESLSYAVFYYVYAGIALDAARDVVDLAPLVKGSPIKGAEHINQVSEAYRRAAEANLNMLDAVVVQSYADAWQMSAEDASLQLQAYDIYYSQARAAVSRIAELIDELPEGTARDYAVLGAAFSGFASSSASLAQHYSYQAEYDGDGNISGFAYDKPLSRSLDLARTSAERALYLADKTQEANVLPAMWYESASVDREGDPGEKIDALYSYWTATMHARTMQVIAGEAEPLAR